MFFRTRKVAKPEAPQEAAPVVEAPATWVPPGHFYSPIANPDEVQARRAAIFDRSKVPQSIDLNIEGQLQLLDRLGPHAASLNLPAEKTEGRRYYYNNWAFNRTDATVLAAMLLEMAPRRIIEVGSGFSSALLLDIIDRLPGASLKLIEPYPAILDSLLQPGDRERCEVLNLQVQDVPLSTFEALDAGDVLFIDSTHVTKAGSDVNFEFFEIFPRLRPGVVVHLHDIFFPFEYPEEWVIKENRAWNELYLLRAFLMGGTQFEVLLFTHMLNLRYPEKVEAALGTGYTTGGSFWMRKR